MSEVAPTAPQAAKATPACFKPSLMPIFCSCMCALLCVFLANGTGKTPNGKMPPVAYVFWAFVACCAFSTIKSIYTYFTAPPCKTS